MEKSANKRWKESGTTLSFKDWIDIENKKEESKKNYLSFSVPKPSDFLKDTIAQNKESVVTSQYKPEEDKTNVLGLDRNVLVFSGLIIVGALGFYFYKKLNKKQ
jgi:hypothetical protein